MSDNPMQMYRKELAGSDHEKMFFASISSMGAKIDGKSYDSFYQFFNSKEYLVQEVVYFHSSNLHGGIYHIWYYKKPSDFLTKK